MVRVSVRREMHAPADVVFRAVSDIAAFPDIQPDVIDIEFIGDQRSGIGTRFVETRRQGKREMKTDLEVTEWVENERVRMVTDSHGTIWDTVFLIRPTSVGAELEIAMDARPHRFLPKIMTRVMKGLFRRGIESYADLLVTHCEKQPAR